MRYRVAFLIGILVSCFASAATAQTQVKECKATAANSDDLYVEIPAGNKVSGDQKGEKADAEQSVLDKVADEYCKDTHDPVCKDINKFCEDQNKECKPTAEKLDKGVKIKRGGKDVNIQKSEVKCKDVYEGKPAVKKGKICEAWHGFKCSCRCKPKR